MRIRPSGLVFADRDFSGIRIFANISAIKMLDSNNTVRLNLIASTHSEINSIRALITLIKHLAGLVVHHVPTANHSELICACDRMEESIP